MKHLFTNAFITLLATLALSGCQNEDVSPEQLQSAGLYLAIQPSGSGGVATRAMDEDDISDLTVLYFRKLSNDKYYLLDMEIITTGVDGENRLHRPFTAWAGGPGGANPNNASWYSNMQLAVFANTTMPASITGLTFPINATDGSTPTINASYEMETILQSITIGNDAAATGSAVWSGADAIPMYVLTEEDLTVDPGPYTTGNVYIGSGKIYPLLRAVAKVTINNGAAASGKLSFTITSAFIRKGNSRGYVYHEEDKLVKHASDMNQRRIKEPSIPANASASATDANNPFTFSSQNAVFYLYESEAASPGGLINQNDCHIVLVGNRGDGKTGMKYMIPFPWLGTALAPAAEFGKAGHVLRNHHYTFNIQGVDDNGLYVNVTVKDWENISQTTTNPIPIPN